MNTRTFAIHYAGIAVELHGPAELYAALEREVAPFFELGDVLPHAPDVRIDVLAEAPPSALVFADREGTAIDVDTSLYAHLASKGMRWPTPDGHVVRIDATRTLFHVQPGAGRIQIFQPEPRALELDAIRTLRGLFTQGVEVRGGVQLHAAGVVVDGKGVLIIGDMWQGKTTLLLEILSDFRLSQLSCDTTVVREDGELLRASGWPSPFSVNHGTLADHPELGAYFPEARRGTPYATLWQERKKSILTSAQVAQAFNLSLTPSVSDLACVLLVRFRPEEPTCIEPLRDFARFMELLRPCYLGSRDPIYHDWLGYFRVREQDIDANLERFARHVFERELAHEMTWAPSPTSLLKRIPVLARAHHHLGKVLF